VDEIGSERTGPNIKSCGTATNPQRAKAYNGAMGIQVDAVYENGVLKPLQPLGLAEHEHVSVTVIKTTPSSGSPQLDIAYLENLQAQFVHAGPAPGMEEVRRRLSKIPGTMTGAFIAEREDR
jgi:predicted DNA-binding antitoxin AbrB/MazE fold protein